MSEDGANSVHYLSFTDELTDTPVSLALVADGKLQSPAQLRAQIMRPLQLIKTEARLFSQRLHCRQAALPLESIFAEYRACGRVRLMFRFMAVVCQRLATATADMHMAYRKAWGWAELVMERVTRGRVRRVQVLRAALVVPLRACAVCLTRAAANAGWF
jgi:hypothetical protein